jgi:hypothetical protein
MRQAATSLVNECRLRNRQVGDVVHINKKPFYIYEIKPDCITFVSMTDNKTFTTVWDVQNAQEQAKQASAAIAQEA